MAMLATDETRYPKPKRRLRLGFVGGGRGALVGEWHATGARLSNRWEIVAGALSSDPETARLSGEDWMLPPDRVYSDYREMARKEATRDDGIDAVVICTPNFMHFSNAEAFLTAGIDVICDKPMTSSLEDALTLVKLQQTTGLVLAMTYPYPYHAMARQARHMILAGKIGHVRQVHVEYVQDWATAPDDPTFKGALWRRDPKKIGRASATGDIGTHAFHLVNYVTGQPITDLRADFHVCGAPKAMEDTAFMTIKLANGAPGTLWVTQAAPGNYSGLRIRVFGERGGIEWDQEEPEHLRVNYLNEPEQVIVRGNASGVLPAAERLVHLPRGHGEALTDAWGNLYTELAIAIASRRDGATVPEGLIELPTAIDGARGVKFIEAAADSHEAGGAWTKCWLDASPAGGM
jgi:predicted dehydrogenase